MHKCKNCGADTQTPNMNSCGKCYDDSAQSGYVSTRKMLLCDDKLGAWLSAALEDPCVCKEMKKDIRNWFNTFNVE